MATNISRSLLEIFVKATGTDQTKAQLNSLTASVTANQQKILDKEKEIAAARASLRTQKTTDPGVAAQRETIRLQQEELKKLKELERARQQAAAQAIKQNNALFQGMSASLARLASIVPANLPFANLAQSMLRATSASLGIGNAMKGVGLNISRVAVLAGAAIASVLALAAAFAGLRAGVKAAADSQEAVLGLANALRTMGVHTTAAVNRATAFANSLQAVTKYTDEEILKTQALLAQLGRLTGEGLERATRATLDLAAGLGRELPVATLIMAKAAQGSIFELRKYGLVIGDNIPLTERWAKTLQFVEEQFGGRAQAELKGFNATARQFGGAFKDILTLVGAPVIIPLTNALGALAKKMLDFVAARQEMQNLQLLGPAPDVGKAFEDLIKAEEELAKKQKELADPPLIGRQKFLDQMKAEVTVAERHVKDKSDAITQAINEIGKFGPVSDAMKTLAELNAQVAESAAAARASSDGFGDAALELQRITEIRDRLKKSLEQRLNLDKTLSLDQIRDARNELNQLSTPREVKVTFKDDRDLEDLELRLKEIFKDEEFKKNLEIALATDGGKLQQETDALIGELRSEWEIVAKLPKEEIFEGVEGLRKKILEAGEKLDVNRPALVLAAQQMVDFLRNEVAKQAPIAVDFAAKESDIRQLRKIAEDTRESFRGQELRVFDPDEFKNITSIGAALQLIKKDLEGLEKLGAGDPERAIEGWNQIAAKLVNIKFESKETEKIFNAWFEDIKAMQPEFAKFLKEFEKTKDFKVVVDTTIPNLKAQLSDLIKIEDFDAAAAILRQIDTLIDALPEEHVMKLTLQTDSRKLHDDLDDAIDKTTELQRRISQRQTIINLAIDTQNFTLALQQLELLRAELKNITDADTKLKLELEIIKIENEIADSQKGIDEFAENARQEMKSITDSWIELPWETAGALAAGVMEGLQDKTQSVADNVVNIIRNMVNQVIAQIARMAVIQLIGSFIPGFGQVARAIEDTNFKPSPPAEPPPEEPEPPRKPAAGAGFPRPVRVVAVAPRPVRLEIPSVARQPLRFAAPAGIAFVPSAVQERFAQARGEHFAVSRGGLPSRRATAITVNALDAQSIRRSLETGNLGKELSRAVR